MKPSILLFVAVFLVFTLHGVAQTTSDEVVRETKRNIQQLLTYGGTTTEQEYIYVTNGIASSISNALDIKNGYTINGFSSFDALTGEPTYTSGDYYFWFATLDRAADKSTAAIIVKYEYKGWGGSVKWFCIPIASADLTDKFKKAVEGAMGEGAAESFSLASISYFLSR